MLHTLCGSLGLEFVAEVERTQHVQDVSSSAIFRKMSDMCQVVALSGEGAVALTMA